MQYVRTNAEPQAEQGTDYLQGHIKELEIQEIDRIVTLLDSERARDRGSFGLCQHPEFHPSIQNLDECHARTTTQISRIGPIVSSNDNRSIESGQASFLLLRLVKSKII